MHAVMGNKPTYVEHKSHRFLIMDAPTDANLPAYIDMMKKRKVDTVVRACEPTYGTSPLAAAKIDVREFAFPDGDPPPDNIVSRWLDLVDSKFNSPNSKDAGTVAVHCVAGLGRAPVLVAIALVEAGMEPYDAIAFIRKKRRGAINAQQLKYIEAYKRRSTGGCCVIS